MIDTLVERKETVVERWADACGLLDALLPLRAAMLEFEASQKPTLAAVHPDYQVSARNLLHYLALRQHDIRSLQRRLAEMGLSSLGRSESHCLRNLEAVIAVLKRLGDAEQTLPRTAGILGVVESERLLEKRILALLGPTPSERQVRIMVTMPSEAADDPILIQDLMTRGMGCMRINCAHDGPEEWGRMAMHLRQAEKSTGRHCKILVDVAGPKLRTGPVARSADSAGKKSILLKTGDHLVVTKSLEPGRAASRDSTGRQIEPARIGCILPGVFGSVAAGEKVWFDDGKIGGIIDEVEGEQFIVRIVHTAPEGDRLKADKGINLPDSRLSLGALTEKDVADLDFVARQADLVGFSFVQAPSDIRELHERLDERNGGHVGIVLKIETKRAFDQLPSLLLAAMARPNVGIMIARGDLAVECGYERMAEVQEEILWIAEAAHLPVIWATQVLEELAKTGIPSRAEVTDAAMGTRADCVMLNKGLHILEAVAMLDDILRRMQQLQHKKQSVLRPLHVASMTPQDD